MQAIKTKTKSKSDIHNQMERIYKALYAIPNYYKKPCMSRVIQAIVVAQRFHENINNYLGDYPIDDNQEFLRRYFLQIDREIYTK